MRTALSAIKSHCLDCSGWSKEEVKKCIVNGCALYNYRFGKMPVKKGKKGLQSKKVG